METIVVTASAGAFPGLAEALRQASVRLEERPLVSFTPPLNWSPLDAALAQSSRYGAVALTSPRAAAAVAQRIRACGILWREGKRPPVWAVGAATAEALHGALGPLRGCLPDSTVNESAASRLGQAMLEAHSVGPVLFPCGEKRRDELPTVLRANGIEVDEVVCYRTVLATPEQARAAVSAGTVVVVASPSVVQLLVQACPPSARLTLVAIGPTTAASARDAGWQPAAVASAPTTLALASAITGLLTQRSQ